MKHAAAAFLAVILLGACATAPRVETREKKAQALLAQAVRLVETASPGSLAQAAEILSSSNLAGSDRASDLSSLAAEIFQRVYPEAISPFPPPQPEAAQRATSESAFFILITPCFSLLQPEDTLADAGVSEKTRLVSADRLDPSSVLPPYLQGILLERQGGGPAAARALYEEALRRSPDFYPAGVCISDIIIQGKSTQGRGDGQADPIAEAPATGAAFSPAAELPLLQKLAGLLPTPPLRLAALARADLAAGQPQAAADAAAQGMLLAPDDPRFFLLRAGAFDALGNWYKALTLLETLLKLKPDQPRAILMKARLLYEKQQNSEQAIAVLLDAETRFPTEASFPELHGKILLETGRSGEGVAALTAALKIEPGRVSTLDLLIRQAIQTQGWTRAAELLSQVPEKALTPALLRLGWQVETNLGNTDLALRYARSLEKAEAGARPLALEARTLVAAGHPDQAMEVVTRALAVADTPALRAELLTIRSTAGSDDPMHDLRTALVVDPENQEALVAISDLFAQQQDFRKAAAFAKQASELSPQNAGLAVKAAELQKRAAASGR